MLQRLPRALPRAACAWWVSRHGRREGAAMHTIAELLRQKGPQVFTVEASTTVLEAAKKMNRYRVGSLVVADGTRIAGIVTERDILTKVVAGERSPGQT